MRDAIQSCSDPSKEVTFSDDKIETSGVVGLFLELIATGKLSKWRNDFAGCEALCDAVTFMRKYDCERPLQVLRVHVLNQLLMQQLAPLYAFMVAAAMDDVELSVLAFQNRYGAHGDLPAGPDLLPGVVEDGLRSALGVTLTHAFVSLNARGGPDGTWPHQLWAKIPADYLWAATKAWNKAWTAQTLVDGRSAASCSHGYSNANCCSHCRASAEQKKATTNVDIAAEYQDAIDLVKGEKSDNAPEDTSADSENFLL